jgi:predicted ATPase/DNA-binding SARP family transcriptional activator
MGTGLEFRILGPLEVLKDGDPVPIRAAKQRVLLASLLIDANRVVPVETLVARLWGETSPGKARNTLQNYVLRLRRLLGSTGDSGPVLTRPQGYLIDVAGDALDLHRFDALVRRATVTATRGDTEQASVLLREALGLWRGQPLSDLPSDLLQQEIVPVLIERWLGALESRIEADLMLDRHGEVLPELWELTTTYPLRERFWAQRMVALYRSGCRGDALACYRTVSRLLAEELGIDPGAELRELHQRVLTADPTLTSTGGHQRSDGPVTGNLPAEMTTFVGREQQLGQAQRLLETARLVTLTGVGGVGKTRLALWIGAQVSGMLRDGVWLADLAPLSDPDLLGRTVAEALGIRDHSTRPSVDILIKRLRNKHLLLMLDNCEHMVSAVAALVVTLLRAAPGLRVLATSRQRLGVHGEHVLLVPPLTVPFDENAELPLTHYEAVRLLADRAVASAADFQITEHNRVAVIQLCQRLDGIPLAIELAAVRLSTLSQEEVLERLDDRFRLLTSTHAQVTPPYHQTLRAVVDWSHDLCSEPEQLLWARLSVFSGGFDLAAAEAVCAGDGIAGEDVLDILSSLVHKSILAASNHGNRTRYRLLETIRQYGQQQLNDLGQGPALRRAHRDYYQDMTIRAAAQWCGSREIEWMYQLRQELPNLRVALDFCLTQPDQAQAGLEIAANLTRRHTARLGLTRGHCGVSASLSCCTASPTGPPSRSATHCVANETSGIPGGRYGISKGWPGPPQLPITMITQRSCWGPHTSCDSPPASHSLDCDRSMTPTPRPTVWYVVRWTRRLTPLPSNTVPTLRTPSSLLCTGAG